MLQIKEQKPQQTGIFQQLSFWSLKLFKVAVKGQN